MAQVPRCDELMRTLIHALLALGGSASIAEVDAKVASVLQFPKQMLLLPPPSAIEMTG
jgi:hypothetical protein